MRPEPSVPILLVDDQPRNLYALREMLADMAVEMVEAASGTEALKRVLERQFAVILLDVVMPELDGFETAQLIRDRPRSSGTPIIFLTAIEKSDERMLEGYRLGAVDYVFKPLNSVVLRAKLAVFVELHRRAEEVRTVKQVAGEQARELEALLAGYRRLSSDAARGVPCATPGLGPLNERVPLLFAELEAGYARLIEPYLEHLVVKRPKPRREMDRLAWRMGDLGAGPRDLVDLHVRALEGVAGGANPRRATSFAVEGRLLALEMMGLLVDYYRQGTPRSPIEEATR